VKQADERDIQALVDAGFGRLRCAEYLLLTIGDAAKARRWLQGVLDQSLGASVDSLGSDRMQTEVAAIAMSHAGLLASGVQPSAQYPFPAIFQNGMSDPLHARTLGDEGVADWYWGDRAGAKHVAHWLVAHYHQADVQCHALFGAAALQEAGFTVLRVPADPGFFKDDGSAVEPFGFSDGLSQPVIEDLRAQRSTRRQKIAAADASAADHLVAAGEFVLGHPNQYRQRSYAPDVIGWRRGSTRFAFNGSYIAVRQIVQDVEAFMDFERQHALASPTIAELMMGRLRKGKPLSACPIAEGGDSNHFRYRMHDMEGFGCPRGAHVRRANPRDSLGHDIATGIESSKLHRLLRRGRSYRDAHRAERGMFFMALNADLERQFAFVQQQWIANLGFGDLYDESDPLLGTSRRSFSVQRQGLSLRLTRLPRFTWTVGGGYFFLPGLAALRFVADLP
jgi:porphyrinogen peroxidase